MPNKIKNKVIVIIGPTASGKSEVAIKLAREFGGEVISADSRQVYRFMNIGSGKITKKEQQMVPHWMLDIVDPKTDYNVAKFQKQAKKIMKDILNRGKIPIICGGTGFWVEALIENQKFPEVAPDWKLRKKLEKKSAQELLRKLGKLDHQRAQTIDSKNKVRLIRAIEICEKLGKIPKVKKIKNSFEVLKIGIKYPKKILHERIEKRLKTRFRAGMIREVENLHKKHRVSWKRLESFGLEYGWIGKYLQGKMEKQKMKEKLLTEIKRYAKRQKTWFKRDKEIIWFEKGNYKKIRSLVKKFIN